jgi:transcriptional regulator with XRE-family HTH domain
VPDDVEQPSKTDGSDEDLLFAPGVVDDWFTVNIRARREKLGMSQADLAQKMVALGWRYYPQTIHRIESGQRKVTVGEAEAVAHVLGTSVYRLTWPDTVSDTVNLFTSLAEQADQAFEEIAAWTGRLLDARLQIERNLEDAEDLKVTPREGRPLTARERRQILNAVNVAREALEHATPEFAVERGSLDYADMREPARPLEHALPEFVEHRVFYHTVTREPTSVQAPDDGEAEEVASDGEG